MKFVVTGGAGFIGSNIVDRLINENHEVYIIDNLTSGKLANINKKATFYNLDLSDSKNLNELSKIFKNAHGVFHTAAIARVQPSIEDPIKYEMNNTMGIVNVLKACVDSGAKRLIYSASSSAYGDSKILPLNESLTPNPISPYAAQKFYGEILCRTFSKVYDIQTVSLRYFNVYGEKQNLEGAYSLVIGIFLNQKFNNLPMTIRGDGEQRRDFTYVGDVVEANLLACNSKLVGSGEVINIGNGDNRSVNQIAEYIGGKKVFIDPVIEPKETLADNKLAKELLNWSPSMKVENWIKSFLEKRNDL